MSEVMVIPFWERYTMTIEKAAKYFFLFRLLAVLNPLLTRLGCPPNFFISIYGRPPSMKSTLVKLFFVHTNQLEELQITRMNRNIGCYYYAIKPFKA